MNTNDRPTLEEVLGAFSMEAHICRATLEQYLNKYPEYAESLVDLSLELHRVVRQDEAPLSERDAALIDAAWISYCGNKSEIQSDPFTAMTVDVQRIVANQLDIPRQVMLAFREHKVLISSVPRSILDYIAQAMDISIDVIVGNCSGLLQKSDCTRAYKSDAKPDTTAQISFEQLLIEAGVPKEKRDKLFSDGN